MSATTISQTTGPFGVVKYRNASGETFYAAWPDDGSPAPYGFGARFVARGFQTRSVAERVAARMEGAVAERGGRRCLTSTDDAEDRRLLGLPREVA